ncbi:hypothetical protein CBR_g41120 [Chara braunii]|uniref:3-oxoacyl-[acyl-carrier-protein] synthase, mitochondrial n=1 Tax=Chara braunii TaxID=69332 RepID=A0A388LVC6_CHABU|nr:hypothetical protein CBR_g41120 [Chara braunii]|eukprot:GBG86215.1 hypothetical protein CBR_g41120 [Chara braunii]
MHRVYSAWRGLSNASAASSKRLLASGGGPTGLRLWRRSLSSSSVAQCAALADQGTGFGPPPVQSPRRVVVTGLGLVTPLGVGVEHTWQRLVAGESGIRGVTVDDLGLDAFDEKTVSEAWRQLGSRVAAFVPMGSGPGQFDINTTVAPEDKGRIAPFVAFALSATTEALGDAGWAPSSDRERQRTGVAIGGGIGCMMDVVEFSRLAADRKLRRLSPFFIPRVLINMAAGYVGLKHGLWGPNHAATTACASGAHSIGDAARLIRHWDADVMVAGGAESCIDVMSLAGFHRLKALSCKYNEQPAKASRPFDQGRDGFVIGEGAGIVVLEEYEHAQKRGAKMYAEIRGCGMSGDGYHMTLPPPDGRGALLAMQRALEIAGLQPTDVDYINAHATSTPQGDAIEARAIQTLFGSHAHSGSLALSSTKGSTGHLMGAAGAVEAIFTILAIHKGVIPQTLNLDDADPVFQGGYKPEATPREMQVTAALSNSFGFGGTNSCLAFTRPPLL